MPSLSSPMLDVQQLTTTFRVRGRDVPAVEEVCFEIGTGETLCLVGESGSGKSVTALSILRLIRPPGRISAGRVLFEGQDLLALGEAEMRAVRGARIGWIAQDPVAALNPVFTVGSQLAEAMQVHGTPAREARARAIELLAAVGMDNPAGRARQYPHQLSGGLCQRILVAMAVACRPPLVVADEPTTALDATIQAQILDLLREMREAYALALLLVTHDLGIAAAMADRVAVMYAGQIVEQAPVRDLFRAPAHPYTRGLLAAIPTGRTRPVPIEGSVPSLSARPPGCRFAPRCPERLPECEAMAPPPVDADAGHWARCHRCSPRKRAGAPDALAAAEPAGGPVPAASSDPGVEATTTRPAGGS